VPYVKCGKFGFYGESFDFCGLNEFVEGLESVRDEESEGLEVV
jgi:hypothetical protein